jgi:hypothetical protein
MKKFLNHFLLKTYRYQFSEGGISADVILGKDIQKGKRKSGKRKRKDKVKNANSIKRQEVILGFQKYGTDTHQFWS